MKKTIIGLALALGMTATAQANDYCNKVADIFDRMTVDYVQGKHIDVMRNDLRYEDVEVREQDYLMGVLYRMPNVPRVMYLDYQQVMNAKRAVYSDCMHATGGVPYE